MVISSGFSKEHYGVWENSNTNGVVKIKTSKFGDYVEFNDCDINYKFKEQESSDEFSDHALEDRYEIVSLTSSDDKDVLEIVLRQYKVDVQLVLEFKGKKLKISNPASGSAFEEGVKCEFNKKA